MSVVVADVRAKRKRVRRESLPKTRRRRRSEDEVIFTAPVSAAGVRIALQELSAVLAGQLKTQRELRHVDYQLGAERLGINPDVIVNSHRRGFAEREVIATRSPVPAVARSSSG